MPVYGLLAREGVVLVEDSDEVLYERVALALCRLTDNPAFLTEFRSYFTVDMPPED